MVHLSSIETSEENRRQSFCGNLAISHNVSHEDLDDGNLEQKGEEVHRLLGEILLRNGSIEKKILKKILENQHESGMRLGELLLHNNLVS